ncbi:GNAT family N-acetyltransferase [Gemella cuniculi]|uniref:GNAT family N-acetyltransferase n=1 Tax=Gemella cuniculi TaxID=150240 RepID=UPI00042265F6|nr:GNAT family N-acetyltransferase [Gemella cuniculi]
MFKIRKAKKEDSFQIWELMKELAIFENYIEEFKITPKIVEECGFNKNPADFYCLVAELDNKLVGLAVYYFLPFTSQNRPAIYLKELYIKSEYRGENLGEQLMNSLKNEGIKHKCFQIKWNVALWNEKGKNFYEKLGAKENKIWLNYEWNI